MALKKNSMQFELILKISIAFILVILGVSSFIIMYMSSQYNTNILQNMNQNIENLVRTTDYYFDDVKTPMVMLSRNTSVAKSVKNYHNMNNKEKLDNIKELEAFVQNIVTFKSFINDIIIVGNNEYLYNIYSDNPDKYLKNYDFLASDYFKEAVEGNIRLYYQGQHETDYYSYPQKDQLVYSVILPIRNGNVKVGYVMCDLKADVLNDGFMNLTENNNSKMLIQDEMGNIIFEYGSKAILSEDISGSGNSDANHVEKKNIFEILFLKGNYVTSVQSDITGWTYTYAESYENFNGFLKTIFYFTALTILVGIIIIILFSRQLTRRVLRPLKNIAFSIQEMKINHSQEEQKVITINRRQNVNEIGIEIEQMIQRMDKLINDNYIYELKVKEAQIDVFLNQLSPHFLYNTLQLIEYQSYYGTKKNVTLVIGALSNILRYSISNEKEILFSEEIKYIRSYLDIYALRYQDKFNFFIEGEENVTTQIKTPKMILEPVINNCMKHGFRDGLEHAQIKIRIYVADHILNIVITDNGSGISDEKLKQVRENLDRGEVLSEHIGLNNVHSVLKLRYGESYGLSIDSKMGEFTEVILKMPVGYVETRDGIEKSIVS